MFCVNDLCFEMQTALENLDCSVKKLTCQDVILGCQQNGYSMLSVCVTNAVLHVKSHIFGNVNFLISFHHTVS